MAGEAVELLGERAAFWPRRSTLLVADLHWGKADTFRATGAPLPDAVASGVLAADLARLDRAVERTAARRILVLGDLIHARPGMTPELVSRVAAWRRGLAKRRVSLALVPGNHDRHVQDLPAAWEVEVLAAEVDEGPFRFRHAPPPAGAAGASPAAAPVREPSTPYTWAGHVHPVARLRGLGDSLRLPCFVLGETTAILPAFSELTGGERVRRAAGVRRFVTVEGRVVEV